MQRWTHVVINRIDKKARIYINGIMDSVNLTEGYSKPNKENWFVGATPWYKEDCHVPLLIDELRIYNRELGEGEIEAEAGNALGGLEPSFIQLGCINCLLEQASKSCMEGYHLCTSMELHAGGYQVARAMGWVS
jgi:hypothetical protein